MLVHSALCPRATRLTHVALRKDNTHMPVSLESVEPETTEAADAEEAAQEVVQEVAPEAETVVAEAAEVTEEAPPPEEASPPPKRRGRAKAETAAKLKAKPKAQTKAQTKPKVPARPPVSDSSSSDSEQMTHDGVETMLLSYLVRRRDTHIDKRRQMWTRLAGLS